MQRQSVYDRLEEERFRLQELEARKISKREWAKTLGVAVSPSKNPGATYNNWRLRGVPTDAYPGILKATGWSYERLTKGQKSAPPVPPTPVIRSELEKRDLWAELHVVLKALHVIDEDETEVIEFVQRKHERALSLMKHLDEIRNA